MDGVSESPRRFRQQGGDYDDENSLRPFRSTRSGLWVAFAKGIRTIMEDKKARLACLFVVLDALALFALFTYAMLSECIALEAYCLWILFDVLGMTSFVISKWAERQKPCAQYSFGYRRFDVLTLFTSSIIVMLGAAHVIKEALAELLLPQITSDPNIPVLTLIALGIHGVGIILTARWTTVYKALQEAESSMSFAQTRRMEKRAQMTDGIASAVIILISYFITDYFPSWVYVDCVSGVVISFLCVRAILPIFHYNARILLQTAPPELIGQLDKSLREASTFDGVLEFNTEHFWSVSSGEVAGFLQVRVRRDANEQMVLSQLTAKLGRIVNPNLLTIQIVKDDWAIPSASSPRRP